MKTNNPQIQEAQQIPSSKNPKRTAQQIPSSGNPKKTAPRHTIIK